MRYCHRYIDIATNRFRGSETSIQDRAFGLFIVVREFSRIGRPGTKVV